jgi:hypothetical protein
MVNRGLLKNSCSLFHHFLLFLLLFLCFFVSQSHGALYVFTYEGYVAQSTDDGVTWSWLPTMLPISNCVDMTSDPAHNIVVVSETGELYRSVNQGTSWDSRGNIPVSDACAVWAITALTFVVTKSGDFYERDASGTWLLLGNVGASDCVDVVPKPSGGWLVFTQSGDCWDVTTNPFSRSLVGNIGSSFVVAATSLTASVIAVTEQGDVAQSVNNGANWSWVGNVSQLSVVGLANKSGSIYLTTHTGEIARSTNQGSDWSWQGNVNQIGIKGITSDTLTLIGIEESSGIAALNILSVYPNPSHGRFTVRFLASGRGNGRLRIFDVLGRDHGTLWQGSINHGVNVVNVKTNLNGLYFLLIESDKIKTAKKIILD